MNVENECTTHHRACDCIEARRKAHREYVRETIERQKVDRLQYDDYPKYESENHFLNLNTELRVVIKNWLDWEDSHDG